MDYEFNNDARSMKQLNLVHNYIFCSMFGLLLRSFKKALSDQKIQRISFCRSMFDTKVLFRRISKHSRLRLENGKCDSASLVAFNNSQTCQRD